MMQTILSKKEHLRFNVYLLVMGRAIVLDQGPPEDRSSKTERPTGFFGPKIGQFLAYFWAKFGYTLGTLYCQMLVMGWATKMGQFFGPFIAKYG